MGWFTEEYRGETPPSLRFCPKGVPVMALRVIAHLSSLNPAPLSPAQQSQALK
eukprot:GDKH01000085.1.p2 GENE.GDKH01000085.1~~GDKH01000085.1.p2  ORF type:complete len:53 (+),score=2.09 GDKH01000085.1:1-159(+)